MTEAEFQQWQQAVPLTIREDRLWRSAAYRLAVCVADTSKVDVRLIRSNRELHANAQQLHRALSSISANIAEGYQRRGRDRARFFGYALGSARESRNWYFLSREALGDPRALERASLLSRIIQLLVVMEAREHRDTA